MVLRIGTDCSGIEAPIQALQRMKIPFEHVFSCDIDPYVKQSIQANYKPQHFYDDIRRDHSKLPYIDLYVCGFPCQSFSPLGKQLGRKDPRAGVIVECIKTIKATLPMIFVLENVPRFLTSDGGKTYKYLLKELQKNGVYNIYTELLNAKDYGLPQNRNRVFIFGIKKKLQKNQYETPPKVKKRQSLQSKLEGPGKRINLQDLEGIGLKKNLQKINNSKDYIITASNWGAKGYNICPTLIAQCQGYFYTTYGRYLTPRECLNLQGFQKNFKQVVSDSQMYKQAGNSMAVDVLIHLFTAIFKSVQ